MCPDFTAQNNARIITSVLMRTFISFEFGKYTFVFWSITVWLLHCKPLKGRGGGGWSCNHPTPSFLSRFISISHYYCLYVFARHCNRQGSDFRTVSARMAVLEICLIASGVLIFAAANIMAIKHYVSGKAKIDEKSRPTYHSASFFTFHLVELGLVGMVTFRQRGLLL